MTLPWEKPPEGDKAGAEPKRLLHATPAYPMRTGRILRKSNTTALYVSAFCLKRALLLLVPLLLLLLNFMDMLYRFLLLALFLTLPAALVSHCAPPLHPDRVHVIIIAWFFSRQLNGRVCRGRLKNNWLF